MATSKRLVFEVTFDEQTSSAALSDLLVGRMQFKQIGADVTQQDAQDAMDVSAV